MRLIRHLNEAYTNWTFPDSKTMKSDFSEYKKKEKRKWQGRAEMLGMRWPLFKDFNHFKDSLRKAEVVKLTRAMDNRISNRSHSHDIEDLKQLVSGYVRPRDVDRIVDGFQNNDRIPYPIVLRTNRGMWIMAGNTRLDASFIMDITPTVLIVDVDAELSELFKSDVPVKVEKRTSDYFSVSFEVDGIPYTFDANWDGVEEWDIDFSSYIGGKYRTDVTGTGNAAKVLAAVIKAFRMWIKEYRPSRFYFYAKEPSRRKLYERFAKMIVKIFKYERVPDDTYFTFKKPKRKRSQRSKKWGAVKTGLKPL